jgi:cell division protein FtsB
MENTNTEEVFPSKPFFDAKFIISAIVAIIVVFSYISYAKQKAQPTPTLDQRIDTLKQLRDDKAAHLKNIENEQKAIYLIDQKIVPLKC